MRESIRAPLERERERDWRHCPPSLGSNSSKNIKEENSSNNSPHQHARSQVFLRKIKIFWGKERKEERKKGLTCSDRCQSQKKRPGLSRSPLWLLDSGDETRNDSESRIGSQTSCPGKTAARTRRKSNIFINNKQINEIYNVDIDIWMDGWTDR